jgi:hypothetical protein
MNCLSVLELAVLLQPAGPYRDWRKIKKATWPSR